MKPSQLKPGTWLLIREAFGTAEYRARFEGRTPAQGKGRPAVNRLFNPEWVGLSGADDRGMATISDYDLARRGRLLGDRP
ncbi:hypothetical protein P3W55_01860 [Pseudomonas citronellolis]|uniref:Uncharacterized protein n=1 Tax=Pseudomonas citronellolis TaxID=53408 RepID=A0AAW6NZN2_9PSED|nr:hypothetical protein [Pseudomonas citronellolis]MDF3840451.1 hypothetical protein [Pseudomonas citronellolis]WRT82977.1 hypothetical protein VK748_00635 [Pseudomonas citronellolis]